MALPCGKCPDCLGRRASGWSFRLRLEDKVSDSAHFITLTYDTAHVPLSKKGFMVLCKKHIQLFFKRLRKAQLKSLSPMDSTKPIRYFAVGEYGTESERPHYHIILFNAKLELIQKAWHLGNVHYGKVSGASVGYCLKYMTKPGKIPKHKNDDRIKEFQLMSKGLGMNYLTPDMIRWHYAELKERMYINIEDGKKISMPRYFKDKIYKCGECDGCNPGHDENGIEKKPKACIRRKIIAFEAIKKHTQQDQLLRKKYGEQYEQKRAAAVKVRFKKMYKQSNENRNKI